MFCPFIRTYSAVKNSLGMLKIIFLELPNAPTAHVLEVFELHSRKSGLFGKGYESDVDTLGAFKKKVGSVFYSVSLGVRSRWMPPLPVEKFLIVGHPFCQLTPSIEGILVTGSALWRFLATSGTTSPTPHAAAVEAPAMPPPLVQSPPSPGWAISSFPSLLLRSFVTCCQFKFRASFAILPLFLPFVQTSV